MVFADYTVRLIGHVFGRRVFQNGLRLGDGLARAFDSVVPSPAEQVQIAHVDRHGAARRPVALGKHPHSRLALDIDLLALDEPPGALLGPLAPPGAVIPRRLLLRPIAHGHGQREIHDRLRPIDGRNLLERGRLAQMPDQLDFLHRKIKERIINELLLNPNIIFEFYPYFTSKDRIFYAGSDMYTAALFLEASKHWK